MTKNKGIILLCFLICFTFSSFPGTTLIKNANVMLPDFSFQEASYIIINGAKIEKIGLMKDLQKGIFDDEFDAEGGFVYPAFIDPYFQGFQKKEAKAKGTQTGRPAGADKTTRKLYEERDLLIKQKVVEKLDLKKAKMKSMISKGFGYIHVIPDKGIIGGTTAVLSLVSEKLNKAVLSPENFMAVFVKTNRNEYPTTHASVMSEIKQLKLDSFYYQKMKKLQFVHRTERMEFFPELDILYPYFTRSKRFIFKIDSIVQQRMVGMLAGELGINPVLAVHADVWRRPVPASQDVILPLSFEPPMTSKYSNMGDKFKKDAEKKMYPEKIAGFFKSRKNIGLTAPKAGDYKKLFENIKILIKQGVKEEDVLRSLTVVPAGLMGISRFAGTLQPGKLASLFVSDKKVFDEKAKIKKAFVEGILFDLEKPKGKPPVTDLTGSWDIKVESSMGNFEFKMTIEQDGNDITGELTSQMGTIEIEEGFISGKEVNLSMGFSMAGQTVKIEISGTVKIEGKDKKIEGTLSMGTFGKGKFVATPQSN